MFLYFLTGAYVAVAIQVGLANVTHNFWILPALLLFLAIQWLVVSLLSKRDLVAGRLRKILFCESPFFLLIFQNVFWPVTSLTYFIAVLCAVSLGLMLITFRKEIPASTLTSLIFLTFPILCVFIQEDHFNLVQFRNEWRLLAEEGPIMSWITRALHGESLFKDAIVARGPLLIYSSAAVMKIFGQTILVKRAWLFLLNLSLAYAYYYFARTLIRSKVLLWGCFLVMLLIHNLGYRQGFAVLSLALAANSIFKQSRLRAVFSGIAAALAVLSSIEVGACVVFAIGFGVALGWLFDRTNRRNYGRLAFLFSVGGAAVLFPIGVFLAARGELLGVLGQTIGYPLYFLAGYYGLPFPNLFQMIRNDVAAGHFFFPVTLRVFTIWYAPPLVYVFVGFLFLRWLSEKRVDAKAIALLMIGVYGWFMFHSAMGRSDFHHLYFAIPTAFALVFFLLDRVSADNLNSLVLKKENWIHVTLALLFVGLFFYYRRADLVIAPAVAAGGNLAGTSKLTKELETFNIEPMRGVLATPAFRSRMESVVGAIQPRLKPGDRIFVFPNMPLYYFVFDSPCPTRYDLAYHALTPEMRQDAIEDLKKTKPKFVIFSIDPLQRLDRVPLEETAPEMLDYLQKNYRLWKAFGTDQILVPIREHRPRPRRDKATEGDE